MENVVIIINLLLLVAGIICGILFVKEKIKKSVYFGVLIAGIAFNIFAMYFSKKYFILILLFITPIALTIAHVNKKKAVYINSGLLGLGIIFVFSRVKFHKNIELENENVVWEHDENPVIPDYQISREAKDMIDIVVSPNRGGKAIDCKTADCDVVAEEIVRILGEYDINPDIDIDKNKLKTLLHPTDFKQFDKCYKRFEECHNDNSEEKSDGEHSKPEPIGRSPSEGEGRRGETRNEVSPSHPRQGSPFSEHNTPEGGYTSAKEI